LSKRAAALALSLLLASFHAGAATDPPALEISTLARAFVPGELVVVTVSGLPQTIDASLTVTVFDRTTEAFRAGDGRWQALVGIDLDQRPGEYTLTAQARLTAAGISNTQRLAVGTKAFPTRTLRVAPQFAAPPAHLAERIRQETRFLDALYTSGAAGRLWQAPFTRPVPDAANSAFGARSVFNGIRRAPHAGVDFSSRRGTPVRAPNAGRVAAARDLFFSGNTVIIDHGAGTFSTLAHLSRIDVQEGQLVQGGDLVGLVGATGRVTGPHLHWALRVLGARIDPLSALELLGEPSSDMPR
jgi:murein DD-endopeptidase MepM/ murein hydrolase activator NlpD